MRDLQRLAAATGIAGILLFVVSVLVVPTPPRFSDASGEIRDYLRDNADGLRVSQYIAGLAIMAFLWFTGTLWSHLRRVEGAAGRLAQIFLVSATVTTAIFLAQGGMNVVASQMPDDAFGVGLFRLSSELAPHLSFSIGAMVLAVGILVLRHGGLPRTLGWYCMLFAAYELVEGLCILNSDGALAPGGTFNRVGPLLFSLWGVWASGALVQVIGASDPRAEPAVTA